MNRELQRIILNALGQVVKLCLRHGIKYQQFIELLKSAYICEAESILQRNSNPSSISRLSVMTGVHRKDVSKLLSGKRFQRKKPNILARIIADWQHHPAYSHRNKPRVISTKGRNSEFAALVDLVANGDLDPYSALFELERIGAIVLDRQNNLATLVWTEFVPACEEFEALQMLVEDSRDLYDAVLFNLDRIDTEIANLHLKTEYNRIPESSLPTIKKWLLTQGSLFHKKLRSELAKHDLDLSPNPKLNETEYRIALATYSIAELQTQKSNTNKVGQYD